MNALIGSQVDYMCDQYPRLTPWLQGGTIKAYAIGTEQRNPALAERADSKEPACPSSKPRPGTH